jgi:hypothetical protein
VSSWERFRGGVAIAGEDQSCQFEIELMRVNYRRSDETKCRGASMMTVVLFEFVSCGGRFATEPRSEVPTYLTQIACSTPIPLKISIRAIHDQ